MGKDIVVVAKKEIARLEKLLKEIEGFLIDAPKGTLKCDNKAGRTYYYHQYQDVVNGVLKHRRKYIKKDSLLVSLLAQKQYYQSLKIVLEKNLFEIKQFVMKYQQDEVNNVYNNLSGERKKLIIPLQVDANEKLKKWREETYEKCSMYPENLRYETEQGDLVRSKSEVIISNILYGHKKDILYKYERPLTLTLDRNTKTIYPDFTIINIHTGRIVYWEHAGRMDDSHYVSEFVKKINGYIANGFEIGTDVVLTFETQGNSLDISVVKKIVEGLIEERA